MAIVISGVNNNDKITASDGTIDLLSGVNYAGIITAPAFTTPGNITANSINVGMGVQLSNAGVATATTFVGNLTGNVNATSNLLLQIGGSEKFRVGSSGQFGIGGANYGTSGQVLTSGGSGSAATWSTINSDAINEGNTKAEVVDTGSDGHFKVETEGSERLRIDSSGHLHTGYTSSFGGDHVNILATDGGGISIAQNNSGNATSGTTIGTLSFQGYHSGGATFSSAEAKISGVAAANHTGSSAATDMVFFTKPSTTGPGSAPTERVQIKSGGGLVSSKGGSIAFSDGYSAIEARAPEGTTQLTVTNTTYESGTFDNEAGIWFKGNYSGNNERAKSAIIHKNTGDYGVGDLYFCIDGNADNSNATVSDVKMKIDSSGQVTKPSQVGFHATGTSTHNHTSNFVPQFNTEYFDIGGGYNNSNYRFTAPVTGRYFLYFQYLTYPNSDPDYKTFLFRKNGSSSGLYDQGFYRGREGQQGNQTSQQMSTYIQLAENDYIEPYVECNGGTFYNYMGSGHSHFWGFLVH